MNIKEIKELIEIVSQHGITDLEVERSGVKVRIRKEGPLAAGSSQAQPGSAFAAAQTHGSAHAIEGPRVFVPAEPGPKNDEEGLAQVRSPIVGTFYRAPNPDAEPFVKTGDSVEPGQVLCIIEAMKLMNEIEAEVNGEVVKIYAENGEPVEFGQALFGIRLSKKL
ncbi:MAG: acetyl-CoA carboxylase biotin carboxyl carrier protein [Acidimicrobiia bacterium]|nr:acetyl-CoA carboxylase biotin carboxyl carrier protein [Acidimicrobiia bacterium]